MSGVEEAALIAALAEGGGAAAAAGGGAAAAGLTAAELAAAAGTLAPAAEGALYGVGTGAMAGEGAMLGGSMLGGMTPEMASAFGPTAAQSAALGMAGPAMQMGMPMMTSPMTMGMAPFAEGAVTTAPGMAGAYGAGTESTPWALTGKNAMRAGQLLSQMGGQPQQQGGPQGASYEQPAMRSALMTQEQITKKWLLKNDPNTYRRIYGEPQGAM